jgi:hypothetical protein
MTTTTVAPNAALRVGAVLSIMHRGWMRQVSSFVTPATDPRADLWSRWGAARFVGDEFRGRFRLECAFAVALKGLVAPDAAARLAAAREALERTGEELMAAGRRRETPALTATLARHFTDELARWCVELELATAHLLPAELPLEARRLLARLRVADALGR